MNMLLVAALLAAGPVSGPATADHGDLRCFRLMAGLSRSDDPRFRTLGLAAANFFLGRIDAAAPGFDVGDDAVRAPIADSERPALLRRCGDALNDAGFDVEALSASLETDSPSI